MEPVWQEEFDYGIVAKVEYSDFALNPRKEYSNLATMVCWHGRYDLGDEQPRCDPDEFVYQLASESGDELLDWLGSVGSWYDVGEVTLQDLQDDVRRLIHNARNRYYSAEQFFREDWPMYRLAQKVLRGKTVAEYAHEVFERSYFSLPLYLYDHGGITMSTGRFSCPWDSGQVGFIYISKEKAAKMWSGLEGEELAKAAYACMEAEVEEYDHYLTGQVYGYVVEDASGEVLDSCDGYLGDSGYVEAEARRAAEHYVEKARKEEAEANYWRDREVMTV
ncbi:MAG: hypothetical protein RBU21_02860 [FCB group bacterium]|jgi:hypothetical protein|nr:hypothetical protein [FCB group bacterium]